MRLFRKDTPKRWVQKETSFHCCKVLSAADAATIAGPLLILNNAFAEVAVSLHARHHSIQESRTSGIQE